MSLESKARNACAVLRSFLALLEQQPAGLEEFSGTISAIKETLRQVHIDFQFGTGTDAADTSNFTTREQLQKQLQYQKKRRKELEDRVESESSKLGGRIQKMWFLRVGISDPTFPAQVLFPKYGPCGIEVLT